MVSLNFGVKAYGEDYLIIFVDLIHASITFILGDNLTSILYDDLICIEATITANAIASICSLDDFYSDPVLPALTATHL